MKLTTIFTASVLCLVAFTGCDSNKEEIQTQAISLFRAEKWDEAINLVQTQKAPITLPELQYFMGMAYKDGKGGLKNRRFDFDDLKRCKMKREEYEKRFHGTPFNKYKCVVLLTLSAEQGFAEAQASLGRLYQKGDCDLQEDKEKAVELYKKAVAQNCAAAQYYLAHCYACGEGVDKDEAKGAELLLKAAEQGDKFAQCDIGSWYENGNGVPKDVKKAVEWYKKSADQNNTVAQLNLARCYLAGRGVEEDAKKGIELLTKAAEQGESDAQYNLALRYGCGEGVDKDEAKGAELLLKAAEQGDKFAQCDIGSWYENGKGVPKDVKKAVEWYKKSADQKFARAQLYLANCYLAGKGVEEDVKKGIELLTKAAEQGESDAQYNLALRYGRGEGVDKDEAKGAELLLKAAEQGDKFAQCDIGSWYENGKGVPKDVKKAVEWYKKSADQKFARAQLYLANCYLAGRGVEEDAKKGIELLAKAAEQGEPTAMAKLGAIYYLGKYGIDKNIKDALTWLEKAAEKGDLDAVYLCFCIYYNGEEEANIAKNEAEALKWLKIAADKDYKAETGASAKAMYNALTKRSQRAETLLDFARVYMHFPNDDKAMKAAYLKLNMSFLSGFSLTRANSMDVCLALDELDSKTGNIIKTIIKNNAEKTWNNFTSRFKGKEPTSFQLKQFAQENEGVYCVIPNSQVYSVNEKIVVAYAFLGQDPNAPIGIQGIQGISVKEPQSYSLMRVLGRLNGTGASRSDLAKDDIKTIAGFITGKARVYIEIDGYVY